MPENFQNIQILTLPEELAGQRADHALAVLGGCSRTVMQRLIRQGCVLLDGSPVSPKQLVQAGACYTINWPPVQPPALEGQAMDLQLLYEDDDLAVVNKPAGMVVHPAAGNPDGTLVNGLLHQLSSLSVIGGQERPGIVHRLDKQTSGLLVVAKNDAAHAALSAQLQDRTCSRQYIALVAGRLRQQTGLIEAPIGRHPQHRKKMAVVPNGRQAITAYQVLAEYREVSLVALKLSTGRTHQIRVHMAHIGHPVLDDPLYGRGKSDARQMLHAWRLAFVHPKSGRSMAFTLPAPEDFARKLRGIARDDWPARITADPPDIPVIGE